METHRVRSAALCLCMFLAGLAPVTWARAGARAAQHSDLWGAAGERWNPLGRLPDFSHAGYRRGEKPLPALPQVLSVKDFGARGDGNTDDTQAFKDALEAAAAGAVFVPEGRYRITDFLSIRKRGVVLRGAGPGKSVLWFPKPLNEVIPREGHTSTGELTTAYSFDYAYLTLQGQFGGQVLSAVTAVARRGDSSLQVASAANLAAGQRVMIRVEEEAAVQSLERYLYAGNPGDTATERKRKTKMVAVVKAVSGNRVHLDRPLRFETRAEWKPVVLRFEPTVEESGVEHLGFEFPDTPYPGHFKELGFNAIELRGVSDCWVRNVRIHNADMGILFVNDASFNTVDGAVFTAYAARGASQGHHAFQAKRAFDNLVTRFDLKVKYVHDVSVENAAGNVFAKGKGADLCFDGHKDAPYENLFTDIDCGLGNRVWTSGGGAGIGRHMAAWSTFWNIRAAKAFDPPPAGWAPALVNLVGLGTTAATVKQAQGTWIESIPPAELAPQDLREAQLLRRLGGVSIVLHPAAAPRSPGGLPVLARDRRGILVLLPGHDGRFSDLRGRSFPIASRARP